ncbi:MAG TPA: F0F1 ATP synthase subunit delta [Patescibacteria group bacterium]|nr:F0F1 ATP synthase subunit delta [Patescibacteria group bacterium]
MKRNEKQLARAFVTALEGATRPQIDGAATELVALLASRNEVHRVKGVIEAIETVWRETYGAGTVKIETAHPLTAALRKKLEVLAPGAEIRENVRTEIIGGAKLRIDETIIDGSIEGHLAQLNQALRNA